MSPKADLKDLYAKLGVTSQGRAISEICRTGVPLRMPRSGRQSSAGGFSSQKMGVVMGTESRTMERAYFRLIDGDADFLEFYEQAYRLRLTITKKDGTKGSFDHIPDLFAIQRSWIGFIEIKTTTKLREKSAEQPSRFVCSSAGQWTSPAAEDALANTGLGYRIVTDQDINPVLVRNLNYLRDFLLCESSVTTAIAKYLDRQPISTLAALFEVSGNRNQIYEAVANGHIFFDLERDYVMDDRAPVYRDRAIWEADLICRSKPPIEVGAGGTIDTRIGSQLVYDGYTCVVLNNNADSIWIRGDTGTIMQIALESLPGLINTGRISVAPSLKTAGQSGLDKIVAAHPDNLTRALCKYSQIQGWITGRETRGIPTRSLRRFVEQFREAEAICGLGLAGLLDNRAGRGNRTVRVDNRVLEEVKSVVETELLTDIAPSISTAHRLLNSRLREKGLPILSRKTFNGHCKAVDRERWAHARFGHKAANAERPPHRPSAIPVKGDRAWEIAHIDSEQIDLELISERTGQEIPLAWLSVMLNINPTYPLAWYISPSRPSEESILMVARHCVRRHNRLPDVVVYDLGAEHRGTTFDVLRATYKTDFIKRPGGNPRFGPEIESFWNSINKYVIHQLKGNRG